MLQSPPMPAFRQIPSLWYAADYKTTNTTKPSSSSSSALSINIIQSANCIPVSELNPISSSGGSSNYIREQAQPGSEPAPVQLPCFALPHLRLLHVFFLFCSLKHQYSSSSSSSSYNAHVEGRLLLFSRDGANTREFIPSCTAQPRDGYSRYDTVEEHLGRKGSTTTNTTIITTTTSTCPATTTTTTILLVLPGLLIITPHSVLLFLCNCFYFRSSHTQCDSYCVPSSSLSQRFIEDTGLVLVFSSARTTFVTFAS